MSMNNRLFGFITLDHAVLWNITGHSKHEGSNYDRLHSPVCNELTCKHSKEYLMNDMRTIQDSGMKLLS